MHCCQCGIEILPTIYNMCRKCLSLNINITNSIKTTQIIEYCKSCERYFLQPRWESFQWGSKELLGMLLSRVKELKNMTLINSKYLFTEENSKKILIEVEIEQIIENNFVRGTLQIKFSRYNKQCPDCQNYEANNFWNTVVQLRHKMNSKRTLLYIDQMCLKQRMYDNTIDVKEIKGGYDYYFSSKNTAIKFVRFIESIIGCKIIESTRLLSLDTKSNKTKNKNTYSINVLPFTKDDLVFISKKMSKTKNISNYLLVLKVTTKIQLIDPITCKIIEISSDFYWKNKDEFQVVMTSKYLINMKVINIEKNNFKGNYQLADIEITKDYNNIFHVKTHLGKDIYNEILCYDIKNSGLQLTDKCPLNFIVVRLINETKINKEEDIEYNYFIEDCNSINHQLKNSLNNLMN